MNFYDKKKKTKKKKKKRTAHCQSSIQPFTLGIHCKELPLFIILLLVGQIEMLDVLPLSLAKKKKKRLANNRPSLFFRTWPLHFTYALVDRIPHLVRDCLKTTVAHKSVHAVYIER